MKMYEALALQNFYTSVHDKKMPIKTAYKLSRLAKRAEEELQFYQKECYLASHFKEVSNKF